MNALVVDDSRATRLILRQILHKIGFEVSEASNGHEGLERLAEQTQTELALVDRHMPDMDGLAFLQAVRADGRYRDLRLIMITGEDEPGQDVVAREAGAHALVQKPFTREAVLERLQQLGLAAQ